MPIETANILRFGGLANRLDPLRRLQSDEGGGLTAYLSEADNLDIDDTAKPRRAEGYEQVSSEAAANLYVTEDEQRAYIVVGDTLKQLLPDWTTVDLWTGLANPHLRWVEVNNQVYATNGTDFLVIDLDGVREWGLPTPPTPDVVPTSGTLPAGRYQVTATYVADDGRESGASLGKIVDLTDPGGLQIELDPKGYKVRVYITPTNAATFYRAYETEGAVTTWDGPMDRLVDPLQTQFLGPPPGGKVAGFRLGRLYLGQYFPEINQSAVWPSQPLGFELFNMADALVLPGEVRMIAGHNQGLIIGCRDKVYVYDEDQGIQELADYGVVPGWTPARHEGAVYFWTDRGLCRGLPFENLTQDRVSVPPGVYGAGHVLSREGFNRYVVVVEDGGQAYNAF